MTDRMLSYGTSGADEWTGLSQSVFSILAYRYIAADTVLRWTSRALIC